MNIIKLAKINSNHSTVRQLNVVNKIIRKWQKQEPELQEMPKEKQVQHRGAEVHWPGLEKQSYAWIENQWKNRHSLTTVLIRIKAKQIANEKGFDDLIGGPSWGSMRKLTTIGQKLHYVWIEKKTSLLNSVKGKIEKSVLNLSQVGNRDQVPVSFHIPTSRSVDFIRVKSVLVVDWKGKK